MSDARRLSAPVWPDHAARFYATALDGSDYGDAVGRALDAAMPKPASVLDIGAGAGHPLLGWLEPNTAWHAVEPNRYLRARLGRLSRTLYPGLRPIDAWWETLPPTPPVELAFGANIAGPFQASGAFLAFMRRQATRQIAWIVPAQRGPLRWCLAGAFPADLHDESEEPAVTKVLEGLSPADQPRRTSLFGWSFTARFAGVDAALAYCAAQLPATDKAAIAAHLAATATHLPGGGVQLSAAKLSALLIWDVA